MEVKTSVALPHVKECQEPPESGRERRGSSPEPSEELWPAEMLSFDIWSSALWGIKSPLFLASNYVVIYDISLRRLIQAE